MKNGPLRWFFGKASIRTKLSISFALLLSVPVLTLGIFSFNQARGSIEEQTLSTVASNHTRLVSELDTRLRQETDFTKFLAYNLNFRSALEIAAKDPVQLAQQLNKNVEPVFWYFVASDSYMKGIDIYSANVGHAIGPFLKPDTEVADADWYQAHSTGFNTIWSMEDDRLYAARTVLDTATSSRMIGVLRVELYPKILAEPIGSMDYMDNGVLLADENGRVIAASPSSSEEADRLVAALAAGGERTEALDRTVILHQGEIQSTGWTLYYYVDRRVISTQLAPIIRSTLLVVGAVILAALFLINLLSRILSRRILTLRAAAQKVTGGEFGALDFTTDTDEIGVVTNSLAAMSQQLQLMIEQVYKMEIEKKSSELKVLQASINPHFLYNCLSGIKWKALYSDETEIANIAGLVATFYRTSLNNGNQVTLVRNELENIKAYIEIQRGMHEDGFDAFFEVDEDHLEVRMLNFMLQPLVENAIQHGIDQLDGTGERGWLTVRYKKQDGYLTFQILNNGLPPDMAHINEVLSKPGGGYGIYNIRQRIELHYDENSGISADITEEGYTRFTLRLNELDLPEPQ